MPSTWSVLYSKIRLLLKSHKYDLMIVHTPAMSWVARPAARGLVPMTIYFSHGLPFTAEQSKLRYFILRSLEQFMSKYTDAIIVMNSDDVAACQRFRLNRLGRRWFYVPGVGVDVDHYATGPPECTVTQLERNLELRADKPMILFLGRFIKSKRPRDVLDLARRIGNGVDFVLAGEGPLWTPIKMSAAKIGPHVKVIEFTSEVPALLARCTLLILPSVFREGLPRVILEACAAGKPVVAYNVRGARDAIRHGETGFLVQPANVSELCEAVSNLLEDDKLRSKMGKAGQKHIREKFSIHASLSATMAAIQEVLQQNNVCLEYDQQAVL